MFGFRGSRSIFLIIFSHPRIAKDKRQDKQRLTPIIHNMKFIAEPKSKTYQHCTKHCENIIFCKKNYVKQASMQYFDATIKNTNCN